MVEQEKEYGVIDIIKDGLGYIFQILSGNIFPLITEGIDLIMNKIEDRIIQIEKRIIAKIASLLIISLGALFLVFAFFFYLKEYLDWSNALAFLSLGITLLLLGLIIKVKSCNQDCRR